MKRIEKFAAHLRKDQGLRDIRVIIGSLGNTKLPAVMVNQLNQPYDESGMILLDADEPQQLLVQMDGWIEGETFKKAKEAAHKFRDALMAATQSFPESTRIYRKDALSTRRDKELWRVSIDVEIS